MACMVFSASEVAYSKSTSSSEPPATIQCDLLSGEMVFCFQRQCLTQTLTVPQNRAATPGQVAKCHTYFCGRNQFRPSVFSPSGPRQGWLSPRSQPVDPPAAFVA